ncbi:MAG: GAF domain-containing protein [Deltaproteobacteria bacterium]|nr:GAF domain-containing protein [Deltaproteobacteria bacterium]
MREKKNRGDSINADHLRRLTQIGTALSAEKDIDRLLEKILTEARIITGADGGTLYLMSATESELHFALVQNESLGLNMGGTGGKITWPPVKLTGADGQANHANVSAHAAITGQTVNIADVYDAPGFNFEGPRTFDQNAGYRTRSMLVVPMRDHANNIIGVLQLLNATDPVTRQVVPFSGEAQELAWSLASQAAVALTNNMLIAELEDLLDAFIKSIAIAIDEKSPYTGGHVRRVADLTMRIAETINEASEGYFASLSFSDDEMRELRMAAWLHDIGKITTPEHVVDKSTKLETIHDRIEDVKVRFEWLKREHQMAIKNAEGPDGHATRDSEAEIKALDDEYQFLVQVNSGNEFIQDHMIERIEQIGKRQWSTSVQTMPLLTQDEIYNLSIRRGTLNDKERIIINNHASITYKMLANLPFPRKFKRIAEFAAGHHERVDGSGYPLGLKGDQFPLQSRIIALADIFEALTAKDRPYKKGKTLGEALAIMDLMVKDRHIDSDIYEIFVKEKIYMDYAVKELLPQQIDI